MQKASKQRNKNKRQIKKHDSVTQNIFIETSKN